MGLNLFKTDLIPETQIAYIYDLVKNIIAPGDRAFTSPTIQIAVDTVLDERLPKNWRSNPQFIKSLSSNFYKKNFSTYDDKYFAEYYAAYYLPNNLYKIQLMVLELFRLGRISFSEKKIKMLDIGSAVGTSAWALQDLWEILTNVLKLYGLKYEKLPLLEIDGIEKYESNISVFKDIQDLLNIDKSKIDINIPIHGDVLVNGLDSFNIGNYDVILISNALCEFPSEKQTFELIHKIANEMKRTSHLILIETALMKDTLRLRSIHHEVQKRSDIHVISPCGKINGHSNGCRKCYSFRRENLNIPQTMKLFMHEIDEGDRNEKLKWSYVIFSKISLEFNSKINGYSNLTDLSNNGKNDSVSTIFEIVSGKLTKPNDQNHYYYKICDQTARSEIFLFKIPKYYEIPKHHFGDILEVIDVQIEDINWGQSSNIKKALTVLPHKTIVKNRSEIIEPRGLTKFKDVDEKNVRYFLWRFFQFNEFYEGQFEILKKVLENQNVLGILATGGGKSITFQLPALLKPGVSLIVSPLKSLMDDQVYNLRERYGFDFVDRIHSGMPLEEKKFVLERFRKGHLKILYVAPERLQQKTFQKELTALIDKGININYFPIDEAHCISEWGHDFRPAYARLEERQKGLPHIDNSHPPIIALTATASEKVQQDVLAQLRMVAETDLVHRIVDRKELSLEVINLNYDSAKDTYSVKYRSEKSDEGEEHFISHNFPVGTMRHDILEYTIKNILPLRFQNQNIRDLSGLIFTIYADPQPANDKIPFNSDRCREGEGAKWLAEYLQSKGYNCKPWYASPGYRKGIKYYDKERLEKEWEVIKTKTQQEFIEGNTKWLCTTKGFGMGIDKPDIRFIIHFGFPGSLEAYFQQIGRAGRDRTHSHCILLWEPPTKECDKYLESIQTDQGIPECFKLNSRTDKYYYIGCQYNRKRKCDYAKQIYFIESGYPTQEELQVSFDYLKKKSNDEKSFPWTYLKKDYLKDFITSELGYPGREATKINEQLIIETLYTLKFIEDFASTYLKIKIKRKVTLKEIKESTNNEIISEHIDLLSKVYPTILNAKPNNQWSDFDIAEYVQRLRRKQNEEILIDEVVQFFNLLNERDDFDISFNYRENFGYEIKLNKQMLQTMVEKADDFDKVMEWKQSQYQMLKNMVEYARLSPFDEEKSSYKKMCRRAHILSVFASEAARMDDSVRCNYCDNCGFINSWDQKAEDITAGLEEKLFVKDLREIFNAVSKDKSFLVNNLDKLLDLGNQIILQNFINLGETISNAWLEQIGEAQNPATNFILALTQHLDGNFEGFNNRIRIFLDAYQEDIRIIQKVILWFNYNLNIALDELYYEQFSAIKFDDYLHNLKVFSSSYSEDFLTLENTISLDLINYQMSTLNKLFDQFGRIKA